MLLLLFKRHWFMRILYFVKNVVNITISKIDKHLSPISITYCYVSGVYTITLNHYLHTSHKGKTNKLTRS